MKHLLIVGLLLSACYGDIIKTKTLACPSVVGLKKAALENFEDSLKLEMYAIANDCMIISGGSVVEALGYDPRNSEELFVKIYYKKTNSELYVHRSMIQIEQGGKKNSYRF